MSKNGRSGQVANWFDFITIHMAILLVTFFGMAKK